MPIRRIARFIGITIGLVVVLGGSIILRLWWASQTPKLPQTLRANSVWIGPPPGRLAFAGRLAFVPMGVWVSCWLDATGHVDRCQFANYKGAVLYEGEYTSCDDKPPLSDARLQLGNRRQSFSLVGLLDGTTLIPTSDCEIRKRIAIPEDVGPPIK
jgi:hypothetical protein